MAPQVTEPPITPTRLKQIANDACQSALGSVETYEHSKTEAWNTAIINSILRALISESTPAGAPSPSYKYAVNSTIIQHLVPTSHLQRSKPVSSATGINSGGDNIKADGDAKETTRTEESRISGRRGMHSATAAFWNESTDGMWSFKFDGGEEKGLDVVISVIWMST